MAVAIGRAGAAACRPGVSLGALALLLAAPATPAVAQSACRASAAAIVVPPAPRQWPAPLDRRVTVRGDDITLRDGLDRLAAAARIRLSYVAELLPLARAHCVAYRDAPVGQVLVELLRGTAVEPVVAGEDLVVLAPVRQLGLADPDGAVATARRTSILDGIVVTGTAESRMDRAEPVAMAVITRDQLARQRNPSLVHLLDGAVPGVWMWQSSPTSLAARYGSVRGASSFGLTYPKIYIDGIEVANPLLVKQFDPSTIERVEVIRGPQGAALYGADAISGVINIVTRHDGTTVGGPRVRLTSTAGVAGSEFASQDVVTQQHGMTVRAGTPERSGGLALNVTTLGAYIPGAFARSVAGSGDVRLLGTRSVFTGTARFVREDAGSPVNPLLSELSVEPRVRGDGGVADRTRFSRRDGGVDHDGFASRTLGVVSPVAAGAGRTQSVRQYTVGGTLSVAAGERWTHAIVLGVDGYRLRNPSVATGPIPSAVDSALGAAAGGSDRVTARATSTARFGTTETVAASLTFTAEHSVGREQSLITTMHAGSGGAPRPGDSLGQARRTLTGWGANSGLVAQANASLINSVFVSAGVRLERISGLIGPARLAALPMLGVALAGDRGDLTAKVRAAYGKGIRPVEGALRELAWGGHRTVLLAYDLAPEQQTGVEVGADLFVGRTLGLHVTRFDQRATNLIHSVAVVVPSAPTRGLGPGVEPSSGAVAYQLQNVGEIGNRGWEIEGSATLGRLALSSGISIVDSRVRRLGVGYTGDLRPGDRMLDVPARTATLTAAWTDKAWFTSFSLSRAVDWTGYDRLAVADTLTSGGLTPGALVGGELREFWRAYTGVTRLRATFTRDLVRGVAFVMTGDNLLGGQRGEPDNVTVVPGRTITAGLQATFE